MADLSRLPDGEYAIKCQMHDLYVGRAKREDQSTRPKPIITIPGPRDHIPWFVKSVGDKKYILSVSKGRTAPLGGNVYAILEKSPEPEEWIIERQELSGLFTIESSDRRGGWVLPPDAEREGTQLWEFIPANKG
ncbi:hypothetical protein BD779DRAFT_1582682 [Infundibulicybe gibba]|nr:hypothetical protein BD779DRAFT_1582682 [Infundibulicybe gibba]